LQLPAAPPIFPTPPFPLAGLLPALASVPNYHSNPITQRVRRKRQRLPPSLLIENASDVFLAFERTACPRRFRSRLATTRPESLDLLSTMTNDIRVATLSGGAFSYAERVPRQFPQHLWTLGEPHVPDANYAAELFRVTSIVASSTFMNSLLWGASVIPIGM